jgi:hypothetical protein
MHLKILAIKLIYVCMCVRFEINKIKSALLNPMIVPMRNFKQSCDGDKKIQCDIIYSLLSSPTWVDNYSQFLIETLSQIND